jgi:L-ribulose-5-phosphate 3-epimerase
MLPAVHFGVRIDEVVERIALLLRGQDEVAAARKFHAVFVVNAEVVFAPRRVLRRFGGIDGNSADAFGVEFRPAVIAGDLALAAVGGKRKADGKPGGYAESAGMADESEGGSMDTAYITGRAGMMVYRILGMRNPVSLDRRTFLAALGAGVRLPGATPLKIGHRQANMTPQPTPEVFALARRIGGLSGVELQVFMKDYSLWDRETAATYKRAAERAGILVPSLAGVWPRGTSLESPDAEECLRKAISVAEFFGAKVILFASFLKNCPRMDVESSYGPVVEMLKRVAPVARDAGVVLGTENSLSAEDNKKLVDLVGHESVRVFWDFDNVEFYGHKGESVTGVETLGRKRICQVHCKNEKRLLEEPGRVDWAKALAALKGIGYNGWYVFETGHTSQEQCMEATRKNIAFLERCLS